MKHIKPNCDRRDKVCCEKDKKEANRTIIWRRIPKILGDYIKAS